MGEIINRPERTNAVMLPDMLRKVRNEKYAKGAK